MFRDIVARSVRYVKSIIAIAESLCVSLVCVTQETAAPMEK